MLVSPLPGIDPSDLAGLLRNLKAEVDGPHSVGGGTDHGSFRRMWEYLEWVDTAARRLGQKVNSTTVDRLVRTRRYELLLGISGAMANPLGTDVHQERLLNTMITNELTARSDALDRAITELDRAKRWRS